MPQRSYEIIKYVPFAEIEDYLNMGWLGVGPASFHSAIMVWLCHCKPAIKQRRNDEEGINGRPPDDEGGSASCAGHCK